MASKYESVFWHRNHVYNSDIMHCTYTQRYTQYKDLISLLAEYMEIYVFNCIISLETHFMLKMLVNR